MGSRMLKKGVGGRCWRGREEGGEGGGGWSKIRGDPRTKCSRSQYICNAVLQFVPQRNCMLACPYWSRMFLKLDVCTLSSVVFCICCQVTLWDARVSESGGCVQRLVGGLPTLPLFAVASCPSRDTLLGRHPLLGLRYKRHPETREGKWDLLLSFIGHSSRWLTGHRIFQIVSPSRKVTFPMQN